MKNVSINLDWDGDVDTKEQHELDCLTAVNGRLYHDQLKEIYDILAFADKGSKKDKLTKEQKHMVEIIRSMCAPYFKGVHHGN